MSVQLKTMPGESKYDDYEESKGGEGKHDDGAPDSASKRRSEREKKKELVDKVRVISTAFSSHC